MERNRGAAPSRAGFRRDEDPQKRVRIDTPGNMIA
jgi:hypothetical protein